MQGSGGTVSSSDTRYIHALLVTYIQHSDAQCIQSTAVDINSCPMDDLHPCETSSSIYIRADGGVAMATALSSRRMQNF